MKKILKNLLRNNDLTPLIIWIDGGKKISGLLSEYRIDKNKPVEGKYMYDIRHSDEDWCEPATLEPSVMVNWFGTIIVDEPIEFPDGKNYLVIEDYSYD